MLPISVCVSDLAFNITPVSRVLSALPRADLLLLAVPGKRLPTLPVSPYPAQIGTPIRAHFISDLPAPLASLEPSLPAQAPQGQQVTNTTAPARVDASESEIDNGNAWAWQPWLGQGAIWGACVRGRVLGYRDWAGSDAHPGTYDALAHLLFMPLPTPGSSGGPLIDDQTGADVGLVRGTRMDSAVEGLRGWAVPAESIYEVRLSFRPSVPCSIGLPVRSPAFRACRGRASCRYASLEYSR